jgi:hypothetical protein
VRAEGRALSVLVCLFLFSHLFLNLPFLFYVSICDGKTMFPRLLILGFPKKCTATCMQPELYLYISFPKSKVKMLQNQVLSFRFFESSSDTF